MGRAIATSSALAAQPVDAANAAAAAAPYVFPIPRNAAAIATQCKALLVDLKQAEAQPADDIDRRYWRDTLDSFEDAGVALAPDKQQRVRHLNDELTALTQTFERHIREDRSRLWFTRDELAGVPPGVWKAAPRDAQGRYRLGLEEATVFPVFENATRPASACGTPTCRWAVLPTSTRWPR